MTQAPKDHLADLADAINDLVLPRRPETRYEVKGVNKRGNPKRTRKTHRPKLPSLLDSLQAAMQPGADGDVLLAGAFESQPSADMGAIFTLAKIKDEAYDWAGRLNVPIKPLKALLPLLVSAAGPRVAPLCFAAENWARMARVATGYDEPYMPDVPCPYCNTKHVLIADLDPKDDSRKVYCRNCKADWTEDTIGLLAQMIEANQNRTTMTEDGPCEFSPDCRVRGPHDEHYDRRGRRPHYHDWADGRYCISCGVDGFPPPPCACRSMGIEYCLLHDLSGDINPPWNGPDHIVRAG